MLPCYELGLYTNLTWPWVGDVFRILDDIYLHIVPTHATYQNKVIKYSPLIYV